MQRKKNLSFSANDLSADNQFMQKSPPRLQSYTSKDERIIKLQQRNSKLQQQVIRIQKALSSMDQKTTYGIRLPQIKSDVIKKELQNAYKQIKQYEYEIGKRRKMDMEGAYVEHIRKHERLLKEKQMLSDKLRKEILEVKKQTVEYTKMLKDEHLKKEFEEREKKTNADIKWLHEKIKRVQAQKLQLNSNLEKEQELVQKIEKDLMAQNYSRTFFQNLRSKFLNAPNPTVQDADEQDELEPIQERDINLDDRSHENYQALMNEVRLFRKLNSDYDLRITLLTKEKDEAEQRNLASRNRLVQVEYTTQQTEKVDARILELKSQLDPKALIPTKIEFLKEEARKYNSVKKIVKPKITMAHLFNFAEVGEGTKEGKRFIDRPVIGKKAAKIIGICYYQSKEDQKILGLKATYLIGKEKKEGKTNILCDMSKVQQRRYSLQEGDYVKTIDCLQDQTGLIVGISMVSSQNQILRGGKQTDNRVTIALDPSETPCCLYGCLLERGLQILGTESVKGE